MIARDFESPADNGANNVYDYTLTATDADGNTNSKIVAVTVTNVVETSAIVITNLADSSVAENTPYTSATPSLTGTPIGAVTYSLSGTDSAQFTVNASTGVVSMAAQNFESPIDNGANNVYDYTLTATDADGNADSQIVAVTVTDVVESLAGQSVIDLGSSGKLIAPVQVEGKWYYFWDRSGDGTSAGSGGVNDYTTHDVLDGIFTQTLAQLNAGTSGTGTNTTDTIRYATINGVKLALPTYGGPLDGSDNAAPLQGINQYQNGTAVTNNTTTNNSTFDDLLAIWDSLNGVGTGNSSNGIPSGWRGDSYWSATPAGTGHAFVYLYNGYVNSTYDIFHNFVALQVL
jgi:hypothetical protein